VARALEAEDAVEAGVGVPRAYAESTGLNVSPEYIRQRARELGYNTRAFHGTQVRNIDKDTGDTDSFRMLIPSTKEWDSVARRIGSHSAIDPRVAGRFSGYDFDQGPTHGFNDINMLAHRLDEPLTGAPRIYDVLLRGNQRDIQSPFQFGDLGRTTDDKIVSSFLRSEFARSPDFNLKDFSRIELDGSPLSDYSGIGRMGEQELTPKEYLELARRFFADRRRDDPRVAEDLLDRRYFHLSENWTPPPSVLNLIRRNLRDQGYGYLRYQNTSPSETAGGKYSPSAFINIAPMRSPRAIFDPLLADEDNLLYAKGGLV
jgi:hypothetical protein